MQILKFFYRSSITVLVSDFYAGNFGGDATATALQTDFLTLSSTTTATHTSACSSELADYLNAQDAADASTRPLLTFETGGSLKKDKINKFGAVKTNSEFSVYPNPANSNFTIEINQFENSTLRIYDISGKLLMNIKVTRKDYTFNSDIFKPGLYLINIIDGKNDASIKSYS